MSFEGALDTTVCNAARYLRRHKHARKIRIIGRKLRHSRLPQIFPNRMETLGLTLSRRSSESVISPIFFPPMLRRHPSFAHEAPVQIPVCGESAIAGNQTYLFVGFS